MNCRQLIEIGARVALAAPSWLQSGVPAPRKALHEYWSASKCRLLRWLPALHEFARRMLMGGRHDLADWEIARPLLEEILAGELLARTFAAVAKAHDERLHQREVEPVAQSVLSGHLDARRRVLHLISVGSQFAVVEAARLNDLRQKVERWSDLVLAHLAPWTDVSLLAFDAGRAKEFADDLRGESGQGLLFRELILASISQSFRYSLCETAPHADLNGQIAAGALACLSLPPPVPEGAVDRRWLERLNETADQTQGLIEELLS
jgi:hypothetical protein